MRAVLLALVATSGLIAPGGDDSPRLSMSEAVACSAIKGYGQYVPIPDATITADEKLLLYYEPQNFTVEKKGDAYHLHLVQDIRVRKRGDKQVIWSKEKFADYDADTPGPYPVICMRGTVALKGLKPGDYDIDIILHDELGPKSTAQQVLRFTVKPTPPPETEPAPEQEVEQPAPPRKSTRPARPKKR
jgi:hypothetical protein